MKDREKLWRKFAPPGHENDFSVIAKRYKTNDFGSRVTESIERQNDWFAWVDKCVNRVVRMRRARMGGVTNAVLRRIQLCTALNEIPDYRMVGKPTERYLLKNKSVSEWSEVRVYMTP